ncbi:FUSC family protein [Cellulomonas sp. NPDC089187]|uniref:FUSC family protein n=1 Tax=Cellulomonas sp. NPDC089187 TaxID=3154970 RepID=UPI003424C63A
MPRTRLIVAVLLLFAPLVAVAASPWHAEAYLVFLALPPTLGGFLLSPRMAWAGAGLTTAGMAVGVALSPWPVAGALVMAVACALVARGSRLGGILMGTTATTPLGLALVSPPTMSALGIEVGDPVTVTRVLAAAGFVALGGLWTALVLTVLARGLRTPEPRRESMVAARRYAAVLVPLMAVATFVCMQWFPDTHAWWLLLTVLVVLHPRYERIRSHARARVLGTVAGGFVAALLVAVVPEGRVLTLLGVLCGLVTAWANLARPYSQYSALLTLTIILLTSGTGDAFVTDLERVGLTVLGAVLVLAVVVPGRALLARREDGPAAG